ncbi:MAG: DUF389 domain-containing protein [Streptosporangiaceae bacterium]|jgi:uncharacterized hydrophobic protein (TIGR00271 family)
MTLHIRVISPPAVTPPLLDALGGRPHVRNLVVQAGAARQPAGDAVQFDVDSCRADAVFRLLRALGLDGDGDSRSDGAGSIVVQPVEADIERGRGQPQRHLVQRDSVPVWDVVEARIRSEAVYPPSFYVLLMLAGLIGEVGILTNSQILIVGAMVVGPEYSAIMGAALGIDHGRRPPVLHALFALIAGFSAAILVTLAFGLVIRGSGHTPEAYQLGVRPVSDLINSPDLFSVVVAVLAGIVGVVSLTEARASALIGVFISVTTIPAAADIGLSIAYGEWTQTAGAAEQLLLNVVLLIAVGAGTLRLQRIIWRRPARAQLDQRSIPPGTAGPRR